MPSLGSPVAILTTVVEVPKSIPTYVIPFLKINSLELFKRVLIVSPVAVSNNRLALEVGLLFLLVIVKSFGILFS